MKFKSLKALARAESSKLCLKLCLCEPMQLPQKSIGSCLCLAQSLEHRLPSWEWSFTTELPEQQKGRNYFPSRRVPWSKFSEVLSATQATTTALFSKSFMQLRVLEVSTVFTLSLKRLPSLKIWKVKKEIKKNPLTWHLGRKNIAGT